MDVEMMFSVMYCFRNLLSEAELQHVWKGLLSNESVVKRAYDVCNMYATQCCSLILTLFAV